MEILKSRNTRSRSKPGAYSTIEWYGSDHLPRDEFYRMLRSTAGLMRKLLHRATCAVQIDLFEEKWSGKEILKIQESIF